MEPPICCICAKNFLGDIDKGGKLVYFKKSKEGEEFDKKVEEGFTGQHPDTAWFCNDHLNAAEKYTYLELSQALRLIEKDRKMAREI